MRFRHRLNPRMRLTHIWGGAYFNPPATSLSVTFVAGAKTAGVAFNITVTALTAALGTATGYHGTVHVTTTDPSSTMPANGTLTNGVGTFSATLKTVAGWTITGTDTVTGSITGTSSNITVGPNVATHYAVTAASPQTSGAAFNFTVVALDAYGNTATGYTGSVHFTSTDGSATLPADHSLTNGAGTFSAKLVSGQQTLTGTDTVTGSITGTSDSVSVLVQHQSTHSISIS